MNHTRREMETDQFQINAVAGYLEHTWGVPKRLIKKEHFLGMYNGRVIGIFTRQPNNILRPREMKIHQPDITLVYEGCRGVMLVIEIDGSTHDDVAGIVQTQRRNKNYRNHGIEYCVINVGDFKREGRSWFEEIDKKMLMCMGLETVPRRRKKGKGMVTRPMMESVQNDKRGLKYVRGL